MNIKPIQKINTGWKIFAYIVVGIFTFSTILPLIWLFYTSFKPHVDIVRNVFALPKTLFLGNYIKVWELAKMGTLIINSIFYSATATLITVLLSLAAGYGFAKFKYKISGFFYFCFFMGLTLVLNAVLIPLFLMETKIGLDDTRLGVLLPYIAFGLPFNVYMATTFIKSIPDSMIEAAFMDGCGYLRIFRSIIIHMATPVAATMIIFGFLANWNELTLMLILTTRQAIRSLPVGIFFLSGSSMARDFGKQMAAAVIGIVPILIFYIAFQKQVERGFAAGAIEKE